ncbi:hypothetical protein SDC9_72409 [bioreactor metagenome]|uniref:Uncharacterized protein n=1 Tax=bioreactor metagenome TaxID=1076179 RepID=A0A644YD90_9ZZZZ
MRHALTAILLTAVLTLVGLTQPVRLPDLLRGTPNTVTLAEQSTGYDLSEITDWNKRAIILLPGLTYYPSTLLTPETADSAAPVSTDKFAALRAEYLVLNHPRRGADMRAVYHPAAESVRNQGSRRRGG